MTDIKQRIAENLKRLRKDAGLKQREMAAKLSVHPRTYQNYELEKAEPSATILLRFADVVNKTVNDLLH